MIGLVIATHGCLAQALVSSVAEIVGALPLVATCHVEPSASAEDVRLQIRQAVDSVETGDGVIALVDLLGGSPCSQALSLSPQEHMRVITGVNLPMLIKAHTLRFAADSRSLQACAHQIALSGQESIRCVTDMVPAKAQLFNPLEGGVERYAAAL